MCCFSQPVVSVSQTNIFARALTDGRQALIYSMKLSARTELAMILPLPVALGSGEDSIQFVDFSGYEDFFVELAQGFLNPAAVGPNAERSRSIFGNLKVIEVGSFEASFVPTVGDFDRLDPRFRLPSTVWSGLPEYARFGFCVFKLKQGEKRVHPMAFTFPRTQPEKLFFPTLHIHDGAVRPKARFDHALFYQSKVSTAPKRVDKMWQPSFAKASEFVECEKTRGLVDPELLAYRKVLKGNFANQDTYVDDAS
jgi:hypothetical protein